MSGSTTWANKKVTFDARLPRHQQQRTSVRHQLMLQTKVDIHHLRGRITAAWSATITGISHDHRGANTKLGLTRLIECSLASLTTGPPAASWTSKTSTNHPPSELIRAFVTPSPSSVKCCTTCGGNAC